MVGIVTQVMMASGSRVSRRGKTERKGDKDLKLELRSIFPLATASLLKECLRDW